jgi:serine/threonine-protein kinase
MTTPAPIGVVGPYNLLERLEPSGPGELYRARDTHRGRTVTLRLLPSSFTPDEDSRAALVARARSVIGFSHPNVTTLFDVGEHDGRVFLAFEFLRGQPLRGELSGRPMNVRRAVEIATQIADAIAAVHAAGYVHAGLSPDSVMLTARGHAKVPAFELASAAGFASEAEGVRLRDYDSPEEAQGHGGDERSDIYSVGAVLYEMLTTRRPMHRGASAPSGSNAHVPAALDAVVLQAVAPDRALRYQSAATLAAELRRVSAGLEAASTSDAALPTASTSVSRVLVLTVVVIAAIAAVLFWVSRS